MTPLPNQEFLEKLLKEPTDPVVVIKFGAKWCGPCKRLDVPALLNMSQAITWYESDINDQEYTAGYAGIEKIPAFLAILNGKPQPLFQSSDTIAVGAWLKGLGQKK